MGTDAAFSLWEESSVNQKPALLDQLESTIRALNYSRATFKTYRGWVVRYCYWLRSQNGGDWIHPEECGSAEVEGFCTYLANVRNLSGQSQNTALAAVLFLYKHCLKVQIENVDAVRAKTQPRLPRAISPDEVRALLDKLSGQARLVASLLYGCGMRIGECLDLRLKDIDIPQRQIAIMDGKGGKSRLLGMPATLTEPIARQIEIAENWYADDVARGCNRVELPAAYHRKSPQASGQLIWYWLFPSHVNSRHPTEGWIGRWHVHPSHIGRSIKIAAAKAGIRKKVSPHTLRHSYATHMVAAGHPLPKLQQLMGHAKIETTMGYVHIDPHGISATQSPLDNLRVA